MTLWYSKLCGVGIPRYISKTTRMASYTLIILRENHTNLAIEQIWNVLGTLWVLHVNFSHKFSLFYNVYFTKLKLISGRVSRFPKTTTKSKVGSDVLPVCHTQRSVMHLNWNTIESSVEFRLCRRKSCKHLQTPQQHPGVKLLNKSIINWWHFSMENLELLNEGTAGNQSM